MNCHSEQKNKPIVSSKILVVCVALVAIAVTAVTVFNVSVNSLFFIAALLACPLMHVLMMKNMNHKDK